MGQIPASLTLRSIQQCPQTGLGWWCWSTKLPRQHSTHFWKDRNRGARVTLSGRAQTRLTELLGWIALCLISCNHHLSSLLVSHQELRHSIWIKFLTAWSQRTWHSILLPPHSQIYTTRNSSHINLCQQWIQLFFQRPTVAPRIPCCHSGISEMLLHPAVSTVLRSRTCHAYGMAALKVNHISFKQTTSKAGCQTTWLHRPSKRDQNRRATQIHSLDF